MRELLTTDKFEDKIIREHIYNALDCCITFELHEILLPKCSATYEFERSLLRPVLHMMRRGFRVDPEETADYLRDVQSKYARIQYVWDQLCTLVEKQINPRSPQQVKALFYEDLAIPEQFKNDKGDIKVAVDRGALEKIQKNYSRGEPFASTLLAMRDLEKTKEVLESSLKEGRWHCSFNIGGTDTGRWSSSSHPLGTGRNLQNIDDDLRRIFIPDPGFVLFSCDQQGAEARLVGYLSGDESYIKALETGDVHTMVASMVFGFEPQRSLADREFYRGLSYRDISKKFTHGSSYGGTPRTLAIQAKTEVKLVEDFQERFFAAFPRIRAWQRFVATTIQTTGKLVTPMGRTRQFWDRLWDDSTVRAAIAFVPQSTVGDLTALGIRRLHERGICVLNNVHDAAVGQLPEKELAIHMPVVLECLHNPLEVTDISGTTRSMLIPWEPSVGYNWGKFDKKNPLKNPRGLRLYEAK